MTDTATLITQLRILGQLTRTEAQVARQRVVQASTDAVRDDLRQNAADADGRVARIADALRDLGALPDLVTPLLGRVAVLVRGAMEQAQPLDEALLGDLALEHQLRDRARYVAALAAAADVPAVQTLAGELEAAHDETVRWLTSVLADLAGGQAALEASPLQRVAAQVTRAANAPEPAGARRGGRDGHPNRRDGDRSGQGGRQGRQGHREQYAARLGVEAADAVVATGRGAAAQVSEAAGHVAGAAADAVVTGRDVAAQTAGQLARHLPGSGPPDAPSPDAPEDDAPETCAGGRHGAPRAADPGVRRPARARRRRRPAHPRRPARRRRDAGVRAGARQPARGRRRGPPARDGRPHRMTGTALRACDEPGLTCFAEGTEPAVMLYPPGVYRAETDTELLAGVMRRGGFARDRDVLDVGTGGGALAVAAAQAGARSVTAVDLSLRSVATTWVNSRLARARVRVRRGDLFTPVAGRRFGLVLSNPPYVPAATGTLPRHRKARCWDAGPDGRALLDRICAGVPDVLTDDGTVLLVHSAVCDTAGTLAALRRAGLAARELARIAVPFGPVMHSRASLLEAGGFVARGQRHEELVVVEGRRDG